MALREPGSGLFPSPALRTRTLGVRHTDCQYSPICGQPLERSQVAFLKLLPLRKLLLSLFPEFLENLGLRFRGRSISESRH